MAIKLNLSTLKDIASHYLELNSIGKGWDFDLACDLSNLLESITISDFFKEAERCGRIDLFIEGIR